MIMTQTENRTRIQSIYVIEEATTITRKKTSIKMMIFKLSTASVFPLNILFSSIFHDSVISSIFSCFKNFKNDI